MADAAGGLGFGGRFAVGRCPLKLCETRGGLVAGLGVVKAVRTVRAAGIGLGSLLTARTAGTVGGWLVTLMTVRTVGRA